MQKSYTLKVENYKNHKNIFNRNYQLQTMKRYEKKAFHGRSSKSRLSIRKDVVFAFPDALFNSLQKHACITYS